METQNDAERGSTVIWYSYDPDNGFTLHSTLKDAENASFDDMDHQRDCAVSDSWSEDIEHLSWGRIVPYAQAKCIAKLGPNEKHPDGEEDWILERITVTVNQIFCAYCCEFIKNSVVEKANLAIMDHAIRCKEHPMYKLVKLIKSNENLKAEWDALKNHLKITDI